MARRMFSDEITTSDAFLDMPSESQLLYYHLGMAADDDGFISNPKMTMRAIGAGDDALKILFVKKFLLPFDNGICVVKHWRINNQLRKDRYKETKYIKEKSQLYIRENGSYTFNPEGALPVPKGHFLAAGNQLATNWQPSIGKVSIGKERNTSTPKRVRVAKKPEYNPLGAEIVKAFEEVDPKNKTYYGNKTQRAAADFLLSEHGLEKVLKVVSILRKSNGASYFPTITSPYDLKEKWSKLEAAMIRKKGEPITKGRGIEL